MSDQRGEPRQVNLRPGLARGRSQPGKIEKAQNARQALLRFLPYLRPFLPALTGDFLLVVVYTLLGLVGPYLMGVELAK